jgi:ATP/maltotriose-dependent transcriptional regulator MalT
MAKAYRVITEVALAHDVKSASLVEAQMVYNVSCGSLSDAVDSARALLALERQRANYGTLSRRLINASCVFRVAGLQDEALELLRECQQLADNHKLPSVAVSVLPILGHWQLDQGNLTAARELFHKAANIGKGHHDQLSTRDTMCLGTRIALRDRNISLARRRFGLSLADVLDLPQSQGRTYELSIFVGLEIAKGTLSARPVEALEVSFAASRGNLRVAFECLILHCALRLIGRKEDAARTLTEYTTQFRREAWPIPKALFDEVSNLEKCAACNKETKNS